jgi:hypothetical protein
MKKILTCIALFGSFFSINAQIVDQFNYTGNLNANGWAIHNGTSGFVGTLPSSLSYTGLPTSVGNKATLVAGNAEDVNKALTITQDSAYYSLIINVDDAGLVANTDLGGANFFGFGQTAGTSLTAFGGQLKLRKGTVPGQFQIGVINAGAGSLQPTFSGNLPANTNTFVVVKVKRGTNPVQASLWINPALGLANEPVPNQISTIGTVTFTNFASLYIRQAGTITNGTGSVQIDEIRASHLWTAVTPNSCGSTSIITQTVCDTASINGTTYTSSGTYTQVLTNANINGCDSTITINLTVNNSIETNETITACGSYLFDGNTLTTSGEFLGTFTRANGCDSIVNLTLSIVSSITYYQDSDGDGFGNPAIIQTSCSAPVGYVTNNTDCNDNNALYNTPMMYFTDNDGDGFGDTLTGSMTCVPAVNQVLNGTDCDDANAAINPNAIDIPSNGIDEDCSGMDSLLAPVTLGQYLFTGHTCTTPQTAVVAQPIGATFSNYSNSNVVCAAGTDFYNFSDWNTTGVIDSSEFYSFSITPDACKELNLTQLTFTHRISGSGGAPTVLIRSSLDNFASNIASIAIPAPATVYNETVALGAAFTGIYSTVEVRFYIQSMAAAGATYRNDNVTVIGTINSLPTLTYYEDGDSDGFGSLNDSVSCVPPVGYVTNNTDCNDNDATAFPGATWYADGDGDGVGSTVSLVSCLQPLGYVNTTGDCDDNNNLITGSTLYYQDVDMDGFGGNDTLNSCTQPVGYVTNNLDCDDNNATVGIASTLYYFDADFDGFGDPSTGFLSCSIMVGVVGNALDCDDSNPAVNPDAPEVCDGLDNNCNGTVDEGVPLITWYIDADNDGEGSIDSTVQNCSQPSGYVGNNTDCDDSNPTPNAGETIFYADSDQDGFGDNTTGVSLCIGLPGLVSNGDDCDDTNDTINPDAIDTNNDGVDQNCDGVDGTLTINETNLNVGLYPNPGSDVLNISTNENVISITISSLDGKAVVLTTGTILNTSNLKSGSYIIKIETENGIVFKTWLKK